MTSVTLTAGVPVTVCLADAGQIDGPTVHFPLTDGRTLSVPYAIARRIYEELDPFEGEEIGICRRRDGPWDLWLTPRTEQARAATETPLPELQKADELEHQLEASLAEVKQRKEAILLREPALPKTLRKPPASDHPRLFDRRGTGTHGPAPEPILAPAVALPRPQASVIHITLTDALKMAVEAAHLAQEYAKEIGYTAMPQFSSEDLRTMANTIMIQNKKGRS